MSIYTFAPASTLHQNNTFVTWDDAFSEEELNEIIRFCETLPLQNAVVEKSNKTDTEIRNCKVAWVKNNESIPWLYDRIAYVARQLNAKFYGFDIYGFVEDMQYTIYEEETTDHYQWHLDIGDGTLAPRKFSLVLQLSDPSEYEGGELQTFTSPKPVAVDKKKGLIAAFPAWTLHQVTPVTKGKRKSLVVWVAGPQFK